MTVYKIRWHQGLIDGGRDTRDLATAVNDVKQALLDGFSHVEIRTSDVSLDDFWRENRDARAEAREQLDERRERALREY